MALTRTTNGGASLLAVEQVAELVWKPARRASVALSTATVRTSDRASVRVPIVLSNPSTGWVDESSPLNVSDGTFGAITITPTKLAAIAIASSEEVSDGEVDVLQTLGEALVDDLATKIDTAWFGALASPAQSGLAALAAANGSEVAVVDAGASFANLDAFAEGASKIEAAGGQVSAFVASPTTALALSKIKAAVGSNVPLLAASGDPSQPTRRTLHGVPLFVSPAVANGVVWGYDSAATHVVLRQDAELTVDRSVRFTTDEVAVRLVSRVGFGFSLPGRIVRIATS